MNYDDEEEMNEEINEAENYYYLNSRRKTDYQRTNKKTFRIK